MNLGEAQPAPIAEHVAEMYLTGNVKSK
jgi:hypothetical protein